MTPHFFSIVSNRNTSTISLIKNLNKIKNWAIQWKMNINHEPNKQAQEIIFLRKFQKKNHNQVSFNYNSVKQVCSQKRLRMYLDAKLNF